MKFRLFYFFWQLEEDHSLIHGLVCDDYVIGGHQRWVCRHGERDEIYLFSQTGEAQTCSMNG
jgi:hypothetical protein